MNTDFEEKKETKNFVQLLFKEHKKKFYALFSLIILILILIISAKEISERKNIKISEDFNSAKTYLENNNEEKAKQLLINIIQHKNKFYSPSSLNIIIEKKLANYEDILKKKKKIQNIKKLDQETKDLYLLKKAYFISEEGSEIEILNTLKPLIIKNSTLKNQANLFMKNYYISKGEKEKAKEFSNKIK